MNRESIETIDRFITESIEYIMKKIKRGRMSPPSQITNLIRITVLMLANK